MSQHLVLRRSVASVPEDPEAFWLNRLDSDTVPVARSYFRRWMRWLHTKPGWEAVTPRELLIRQLQAEDPYAALDLLQEFIGTLVGRKSSKGKTHWAVTSFFRHNRCGLPSDPSLRFTVTGLLLRAGLQSRISLRPTMPQQSGTRASSSSNGNRS
jgi:hypothetical protein